MATIASPLTPELVAFLDEVMPVFVGTKRSNGTVQMNPIWYERRGDEIWLNPASSRAWGKRLTAGADVTLLFVDPRNQWRWAQVQGEVIDQTAEGGEDHIDRLSRRYLGRDYGAHRADDPRRIVRVRPTRITGSFEDEA
jgi:PPOX class probable F420-dependent enzyme